MSRDKFGLIGKTLQHSFSPNLHSYLGDYDYELFEMEREELEEFFKRDDIKGVNITMPYKKDAMKYCDEFSEEVSKMGCINTAVLKGDKIIGYNTDYFGAMEMLKDIKDEIKGNSVAILGNGSTSDTMKVVLQDLDAGEIINVSRSGDIKFEDLEKYDHVQVIINTTPVGMFPDNLKSLLNLKDFPNLKAVGDVVYNPLRTLLILDARRLGLKTVTGLKMLVYQGIKAGELFMDQKIEEDIREGIYNKVLRDVSNIVLIGMPGSGKTSIGKSLAKKLNRPFIDLDKEIEKTKEMTIPDIFSEYGEDDFRALERLCCVRFGKKNGVVIATGGGVVIDKHNFNPLKQNGVIAQIDRQLTKLATKGRPLSKGGYKKLEKMQAERSEKYQSFADFKVVNIYHPKCVEDIIDEFNKTTGN